MKKEEIFRYAHIEQLLSYVVAREETGWYYGNRKQFEKRHEEIKNLLTQMLNASK